LLNLFSADETEIELFKFIYLWLGAKRANVKNCHFVVKVSMSLNINPYFIILKGSMPRINHCGDLKFHWAKVIINYSYSHLVKKDKF